MKKQTTEKQEEQRSLLLRGLRGGRAVFFCVSLAGMLGCVGGAYRELPPERIDLGPKDVPVRVKLIGKPSRIAEELLEPEGWMQQSFSWSSRGAVWRIYPPSGRTGSAGFGFRDAVDIPDDEKAVLSFRMRNPERDPGLFLGLVDSHVQPPRVVRVPLSDIRMWAWMEWGLYAVHLDDLCRRMGQTDPVENKGPTFRWADISALQIIVQTNRNWAEPIEIRDLIVGPLQWGSP
jgi:hypothetical protein